MQEPPARRSTPWSMTRCDLHVHSARSTDSGNYALRRARLGESYTEPDVLLRHLHSLIAGHDARHGHGSQHGRGSAAHRAPAEHVPVGRGHDALSRGRRPAARARLEPDVEQDHRDLQRYRVSVYELVDFLRERCLVHALAHPLYRMGAPLTLSSRRAHDAALLGVGRAERRPGTRELEHGRVRRWPSRSRPALIERLAERHGHVSSDAGTHRSQRRVWMTTAPWTSPRRAPRPSGLVRSRIWTRSPPVKRGSKSMARRARIQRQSSPMRSARSALKRHRAWSGGRCPPRSSMRRSRRCSTDGTTGPSATTGSSPPPRSLSARGLSDGARRGARSSPNSMAGCRTLGPSPWNAALEQALDSRRRFVGAVRHHAETRIGVRELQA